MPRWRHCAAGVLIAGTLVASGQSVSTAVAGPDTARALSIRYTGTAARHAVNSSMDPSCGSSPGPDQSPCWAGTDSFVVTFDGWSVDYNALRIDHAGGPLTTTALVRNMFVAARAAESGTWFDGNTTMACQGNATLALNPASPPAVATLNPSGLRSGVLHVEAPPMVVETTSAYDCPYEVPSSAALPAYPDGAAATITLDSAALKGTRKFPVDESNPGASVPRADCTTEVQAQYSGVQDCLRKWSFVGDVSVTPDCGVATIHGDDVTLIPGLTENISGPTIVYFGDASTFVLSHAKLRVDPDCFSFAPGDDPGVDLVSGSFFGDMDCASSTGCSSVDAVSAAATPTKFPLASDTRAAAAPQSTFTLSARPSGARILHVISGVAVLSPAYHGKRIPAGETVTLPASGGNPTPASWPAADQRLIPRGQRPPSVGGLGFVASSVGVRVQFVLGTRARVGIAVRSRGRIIHQALFKAQRGLDHLTLPAALRAGRYTLEVVARDDRGRVTVLKRGFGI